MMAITSLLRFLRVSRVLMPSIPGRHNLVPLLPEILKNGRSYKLFVVNNEDFPFQSGTSCRRGGLRGKGLSL
jgi:hypothetical protein